MNRPAAPPAPYYPALTGLRALAAFSVFAFHYHDTRWFGWPALDVPWDAVLRELHIGVSIFFTLSGFLITRRYAQQPFTLAAGGVYLLRRVARLLPVYVVLVTVTLVLSYSQLSLKYWLLIYGVTVTLLKGFYEPWLGLGIGQAWSLTVEEGFYVLAPLLFWLGRRYGPSRAWPLLAVAMLGLGLGIYTLVPALGTPMFVLKVTIFGRLPEFLIGAAFAWIPAQQPSATRFRTAIGGSGILAMLLVLVSTHQWAGVEVSLLGYPGIFLNNLALPCATGLLLHGLATESTRLARGLSTPLWQLLGKTSYCFYLLHMGFLPQALVPIIGRWLTGGPALTVLFGLLVVASIALYYGLEKPAHRWLLARFGYTRSAAVAPAPLPSRA